MIVARAARYAAFRAARIVASAAGQLAARTHGRATLLARVVVVLAHDGAAVRATLAVPQRQFHKRALWVVVPQDTRDERKEVQQPPLSECLANGEFTFALTQKVIHHVRMGDILT